MRFESFAEVKNWYDQTKPIISKNHSAADDIRPIHQRRYKWERIAKVNDNKFAICDGSWTPMGWCSTGDKERAFNMEVVEKCAPIIWEQRDDGEYLTIRGCANGGYSISRYKILDYCLPWTLRHSADTRQGKHWVTDRTGEPKEYRLPKFKVRTDWQNHTLAEYDDRSLTFKRIVGEDGKTTAWERIGEVVVLGTTLDLERKKQLRPALKSFYEWMTTMRPLIPTDWESANTFRELMAEGLGTPHFWGGSNANQITPQFAEAVISNDESPYRLAFAHTLLRWIEVRECPNKHQDKYIWNREVGHSLVQAGAPFTEEETAAWYKRENKRIKASYNRYMNKVLGLFNEVTV